MRILLELPIVGVDKREKRGEKSRAIKRKDKSPKRLLITLAKIWAEKSMAYLFKTIQDYSAQTTIKTLLLKFLISFTLISLVVIMIKSASIALSGLASSLLPGPASSLLPGSVST